MRSLRTGNADQGDAPSVFHSHTHRFRTLETGRPMFHLDPRCVEATVNGKFREARGPTINRGPAQSPWLSIAVNERIAVNHKFCRPQVFSL